MRVILEIDHCWNYAFLIVMIYIYLENTLNWVWKQVGKSFKKIKPQLYNHNENKVNDFQRICEKNPGINLNIVDETASRKTTKTLLLSSRFE
jgi:hypothetical protein